MIKIKAILLLSIGFLYSCNSEKLNVLSYRKGTFKSLLEDSKATSIIIRKDSIQIEIYEDKRDTFHIEWETNFSYKLQKRNPKTTLDSIPFIVKITSLRADGYDFKGYFENSDFTQKGSVTQLDTIQ